MLGYRASISPKQPWNNPALSVHEPSFGYCKGNSSCSVAKTFTTVLVQKEADVEGLAFIRDERVKFRIMFQQ